MKRRNFLSLIVGSISLLAFNPAWAEKVNILRDGRAIQGYDPVAYFTQNKAVYGSEEITVTHEGAVYHFVSERNRQLFSENPDKYIPAYGGFCAYAAAKGYIAPIDPAAFSIVDEKLYLNYSLSVRDLWEEDIEGHIKTADANWPKLSQQ